MISSIKRKYDGPGNFTNGVPEICVKCSILSEGACSHGMENSELTKCNQFSKKLPLSKSIFLLKVKVANKWKPIKMVKFPSKKKPEWTGQRIDQSKGLFGKFLTRQIDFVNRFFNVDEGKLSVLEKSYNYDINMKKLEEIQKRIGDAIGLMKKEYQDLSSPELDFFKSSPNYSSNYYGSENQEYIEYVENHYHKMINALKALKALGSRGQKCEL